MQRLLMIEVGVQRTFVFIIIETKLKTGIHITCPDSILILFHTPFPIEVLRTVTAFLTQTHHITGNTRSQFRLQSDVVDLAIFAGNQDDLIFHVTIRLDLCIQVHQEAAVLIGSMPADSTRFPLCHREIQILPSTAIGSQVHRLRQYVTSRRTNLGYCFFEVRSNLRRQTCLFQCHRATQQ